MARRDEGAYPKVRDRGATKTAGMDRRPGWSRTCGGLYLALACVVQCLWACRDGWCYVCLPVLMAVLIRILQSPLRSNHKRGICRRVCVCLGLGKT